MVRGTNKKRGAGSARGARIQILSAEMPPLSEGYIARGWSSAWRLWRSGSRAEDQDPDPDLDMASSRCSWVALFLLSAMMSRSGVFGRAVGARGPSGAALRADASARWRRGAADTQRERCAELAAPWQENTRRARADNATLLQLRVRPLAPARGAQGLVFPGKSLFGFIRRVYRCCQDGVRCRSVKGIQGHRRGGKRRRSNVQLKG